MNRGGYAPPHFMQPTHPAPDCTAILVAAGSSRRLGTDKLVWPLAGVPVLRRTLEAFLAADSIAAVVVVCPPERWKSLGLADFQNPATGEDDGAIKEGGSLARLHKPVTRVDGGTTRQESVACGLAALAPATGWVAVHDGARPLIEPADIDRCVAAAREHRAASLARRATETMQRSDAADFSARSVSREHLWCMETPQVFETALLRAAYAAVAARGWVVTDEVSALQAIGARVKFVESRHPNLKITTPADLTLAAALLTLEREFEPQMNTDGH